MQEQRVIPKELQVGKTFKLNQEAKNTLANKLGHIVIPLTGRESILNQRNQKKDGGTQSSWHIEYPEFEGLLSKNSEVAIIRGVFLPESNNKSWTDQKKMVKEYEEEVTKHVKGVKVIIGNAPDNLEIIRTANKLYGRENGIGDLLREGSARCEGNSPIDNIYSKDGFGVTVGQMNEEGKVLVTGRDNRRPKQNVYVIAMVVPEELPVEEAAK